MRGEQDGGKGDRGGREDKEKGQGEGKWREHGWKVVEWIEVA